MTTPADVVPRRFRRAPVITEAVQWDGTTEHANALLRWMNTDPERGDEPKSESEYWLEHRDRGVNVIGMRSFGITDYAGAGDWIVRASSGVYAPSNEAAFRTLHTEIEPGEGAGPTPSPLRLQIAVVTWEMVSLVLVVASFIFTLWAIYTPGIALVPALALSVCAFANLVLLGGLFAVSRIAKSRLMNVR